MTTRNLLAGCTVLFNANQDVINNLNTYYSKLGKLFIIDNSSAPNQLVIEYTKDKQNVVYVPLNENTGIAYALNLGCQLAKDEGFKWILTMDQDSCFVSEKIFNYDYEELANNHVAIVAAAYVKNLNGKVFQDESLISVKTVITSGNFLQLDAWKKVGEFKNFMFIDEVDNEFCLRLKLVSYKILITREISLSHNLGEKISTDFLKRKISITTHNPVRVYYMVRNTFYLTRLYALKFPLIILERLYTLSKSVIKILFFYNQKRLYSKYVYYAITDFFNSRFGKFEDNRQKA